MVFKRRDPRHWLEVVARWFYPRGGWGRAFQYVRHRLHRLPGTPESIARGIFAGAFTVFTPFFGLHFLVAAMVATVMRGNILAALLATFLGNPLTYIPIGIISLQTGHFLLGTEPSAELHGNLSQKFLGASHDLTHNFMAMFTDRVSNWDELGVFYHEVFFPYMVGGIIPGLVCGTICYYVSVPLIRAYQHRRATRLQAKLEKRRRRAAESAVDK